jgi:phosphoserine phosphatase RsbU/P
VGSKDAEGEPVKVLIVEDDPVTSLILANRVRAIGHEVLTAPDGREGWYTYVRESPRIIITDWMMPVVDGIELCRMVRADRRARYTYIIMLTGLDGREHFLAGMNAGADDLLTKPVDLDTLRARLRAAERIVRLQTAARDLEGILPICAYCKRIRDEENTWHTVEEYVTARTDTSFASTLCPECGGQAGVPVDRVGATTGQENS